MSTLSFTCGDIFPTGCVLVTAKLPDFFNTDDTFPCNGMLDDYLEKTGDKIDDILSDTDLTGLDPKCFSFNPSNVTIKELHQEQIDKICDNEAKVTSLESIISTFNVGNKLLEIELGCLAPLADPCEIAPDTYTLISVLLTLKSEICSLKAQLAACQQNGCTGTSGTSGTSGISNVT